MRTLWVRFSFFILAFAVLNSASLYAQTDVALSLYGTFNKATTGSNDRQSQSDSAGALIELRHIKNPLVGFEATYAFNRANQAYSLDSLIDCFPTVCVPSGTVSADAHEITGDWLVSLKLGGIRPFALGGVGVILNVPVKPSGSTSLSTNTSTEPVYVYGGGLDWRLIPHLGLRLQYRGNVYKAPQLVSVFSSTNAFTHSAEPMIGAYFRF